MTKVVTLALGLALALEAIPGAARASLTTARFLPMTASAAKVRTLRTVTLDDGRSATIGSDHRFYLVGEGGQEPAPAGRYTLDSGARVTVGADAMIPAANFKALTARSSMGVAH